VRGRRPRPPSDNDNPSGVFFTLFLRILILLRELECVVEAPTGPPWSEAAPLWKFLIPNKLSLFQALSGSLRLFRALKVVLLFILGSNLVGVGHSQPCPGSGERQEWRGSKGHAVHMGMTYNIGGK
jgi:hypothetical protein